MGKSSVQQNMTKLKFKITQSNAKYTIFEHLDSYLLGFL